MELAYLYVARLSVPALRQTAYVETDCIPGNDSSTPQLDYELFLRTHAN